MGYHSPPVTISYHLGSINFAGAPAAQALRGPKGMTGRLRDVFIMASTAFTADTTPAKIKIGTASDDDAYALVEVPVTAATDTFMASYHDTNWELSSDPIALDTQIEVAFVAPTGGAATGTGLVTVVMDWF